MSEKTREVPQFADATYAHTLVIESTHEYKVHGPDGSNFPWTIYPMDLVFISTFNDQSMSIGCVGKLGHFFGFLRHYLSSCTCKETLHFDVVGKTFPMQ